MFLSVRLRKGKKRHHSYSS